MAGTPSTWSASDASAIGATLSNGGLTVSTSVSGWNSLRGTSSQTTGKLYVEILVNAAPSTTQWCLMGFASSSFTISSYLGTSNYSMGFQPHYSWAGSSGFTAGNVGTMPNPATNDVFGLAIDFAGNIWIAQNNVWLFSGNPAAGTGPAVTFAPATVGALFVALSLNNGPPSGTYTLQATAASQTYAAPAGFTAWDGPAPVLDGTNTGTNSGGTTVAAALTTTGTNRIVCALVYVENVGGTQWLTGVTGGGLTWNKRTSLTTFNSSSNQNGAQGQAIELWWALAPTALSAVTITATGNSAWDDAAILVFGVSGCNTTNPWDANASVPARINTFTNAAPTFHYVSTTQANDFLIFGWGSNGNNGAGTLPTGFTQIGYVLNSGGSQYAALCAAYLGVTATQSNQTYAWRSNISGGATAAIFDALTADTGGSATSPRPTYEIITTAAGSSVSSLAFSTAGISANDVIVIVSYAEQSGGGPAITSVSGGSLTWTQRSRSHGTARGSMEVWYAQVTGTLAVTTVTVTYAATCASALVEAFAVAGCSSAIWDANASLPATQSNLSGTTTFTPSVTISTTQAHDLILASAATRGTFTPMPSVPSGFQCTATVGSTGAGQGVFGNGTSAFLATVSGAAVTWSANIGDQTGTTSAAEYAVDALTADTPSAAGTQAMAMILA